MLSIIFSLFGSMFFNSYLEVVALLSILIPISLSSMYKTNIFLQDIYSSVNDMNSPLIFMSISLVLLIYLASWAISSQVYSLTMLVLLITLLFCFSVGDLLWFYIMFESSLLPILFLIVGWGYQPERLQAGLYMILYTVLGSLPLLIIILYLGFTFSTFNLYLLWLSGGLPGFFFLLGMLAFFVKLPVYGFHIWLPKAHVEAPLGGSMILAGVLLKLGGYGLYIYIPMGNWSLINLPYLVLISLALWGGLLSAFICLSQMDIKSMIAFSSIVHMSLVVLGTLSSTSWGLSCALITMISHGWASSALFLIAYSTYEKVGSRSFNYTKGILTIFPVMSFLWFILVAVNMSVPPTINLIGELCAIPVTMWMNVWFMLVLLGILFLAVAYNMYLYTKINHGPASGLILPGGSLSSRATLAVVGHLLPLSFMFSMPLLSPYTETCM